MVYKKRKMTQLFKDDGAGDLQEVGLFDICEWWIETYPDDVFVNEPKEVVQVRESMKKILEMRK